MVHTFPVRGMVANQKECVVDTTIPSTSRIPMRGLTVHRPWAWSIIFAGKDVENRSRATRWRGMLAIHAGLGSVDGIRDHVPGGAYDRFPDDAYQWAGYIIGVVDLTDVAPSRSPWAELATPNHWHLSNPRPLKTPVRARGLPGLWIPPEEVRTAIFDQVGAADDTRPRPSDGTSRTDTRPAPTAPSGTGESRST